jgi:hypothetical protein
MLILLAVLNLETEILKHYTANPKATGGGGELQTNPLDKLRLFLRHQTRTRLRKQTHP